MVEIPKGSSLNLGILGHSIDKPMSFLSSLMDLKQRYDHTYKILDRESQLFFDSICKSFSVGVAPALTQSKPDYDSDSDSEKIDEMIAMSSDSLTVLPTKEGCSDSLENNSCHIRALTTKGDVVTNVENVDMPDEVGKREKVDTAEELTTPIQVDNPEIDVKPITVAKLKASNKSEITNNPLKVVDHEKADKAYTPLKFVKSQKIDNPDTPFNKAELQNSPKAEMPSTNLDRLAYLTDTSNDSEEPTSRFKFVPNDIKDLNCLTDVPEGSILCQIIVKSGLVDEKIYIGPKGEKLIFKRLDD